jgi:ABC-type phosphate/phosphonate transport system permease subunit
MIREAWKDRMPLTWPAVWEAIGMSLAGIGIAGIVLVIIIYIVTWSATAARRNVVLRPVVQPSRLILPTRRFPPPWSLEEQDAALSCATATVSS